MRIRGWVAAALLLAGTVCAVPANDEIYIANSGTGVLVLRQEGENLAVPLCTLYPILHNTQRYVAQRDDNLLTVLVQYREPAIPPGPYKDDMVHTMRRSTTVPGDYDLTAFQDFPGQTDNPTLLEPYQSYLHRLDDPRLIAYYRMVSEESDAPATTQTAHLAAEIVAAHPDDLYARLVYWDSLMRTRNASELQRDLTVKRDRFVSASLPLRVRYSQAIDDLRSLLSSQAGRNSYDLVAAFRQGHLGLDALMHHASDFITKPDFLPRRGGLAWTPRYLDEQVLAKVIRVQATLLLFRGRFQQSRDILLSIYRLGQLLAARAVEIESLLGTAIRNIEIGGLDLYAQNACNTPEELKLLMDGLDWMDRNPPSNEGTTNSLLCLQSRDNIARNFAEKRCRERVADAKFALLRAAVATRYLLLANSAYPRSSNFGPLLANGPPKDPFADGPLRYVPEYGRRSFTLYSVGPDGRDNRGTIEYDPTNGTVSIGDITLEVPRTPKYPFPRRPLRTGDEAAVRRQFPNGLPVDIFADKRGWPLSIAPMSPIRIFSYGPDANQVEAQSLQPYLPLVPYDPTNGLISRGDLYTDLFGP